jgi:hypothetical protein
VAAREMLMVTDGVAVRDAAATEGVTDRDAVTEPVGVGEAVTDCVTDGVAARELLQCSG